MSSQGDMDDMDGLISDQIEDFNSLQRQINSVTILIEDKKPASVLLSRNDYIKFLWNNCQNRNA